MGRWCCHHAGQGGSPPQPAQPVRERKAAPRQCGTGNGTVRACGHAGEWGHGRGILKLEKDMSRVMMTGTGHDDTPGGVGSGYLHGLAHGLPGQQGQWEGPGGQYKIFLFHRVLFFILCVRDAFLIIFFNETQHAATIGGGQVKILYGGTEPSGPARPSGCASAAPVSGDRGYGVWGYLQRPHGERCACATWAALPWRRTSAGHASGPRWRVHGMSGARGPDGQPVRAREGSRAAGGRPATPWRSAAHGQRQAGGTHALTGSGFRKNVDTRRICPPFSTPCPYAAWRA